MKIGLGSDDAGASLRRAVGAHLEDLGHDVDDYGVDDDSRAYPSVAFEVADAVSAGRFERAILVCGTGIGVMIAANKVPGVYAALCPDVYSAERARKSNNAQILTMGARVIGEASALTVVDAWLESEFESARSGPKVAELAAGERRHAQAHK
jgi:ribose 5-phosphate isomerase B